MRHDEDAKCGLVCKSHYGKLRHLKPRDVDELERVLTRAFARACARGS